MLCLRAAVLSLFPLSFLQETIRALRGEVQRLQADRAAKAAADAAVASLEERLRSLGAEAPPTPPPAAAGTGGGSGMLLLPPLPLDSPEPVLGSPVAALNSRGGSGSEAEDKENGEGVL